MFMCAFQTSLENCFLGALVEAGHDEFAVTKAFGCSQAAVAGTNHHVEQLVAGCVHVVLALEKAGHVHVNVLTHGAHCPGVAGQFDDRQDGVADDVALACGEEMHHIAGCCRKGHHFCCRRRGVHEPQAGAGGAFGLVEAADDRRLAADFLDVAKSLFLDGGQAAFDIALGRLGIAQVIGLVIVDNLGVAVKEVHELVAHFVVDAAGCNKMLATGNFRGLAEERSGTGFPEFVEGVANRGVGGNAGSGTSFE